MRFYANGQEFDRLTGVVSLLIYLFSYIDKGGFQVVSKIMFE